jgi:AraC family transcriptional regulator of adaptative response/methylated-DNA-[protein]-cysteine methyltransferase
MRAMAVSTRVGALAGEQSHAEQFHGEESAAAAIVADPRWAQLRARDAHQDGRFFYSVKTTGVYCKPSCAARPARPENVAFHATAADAERAGFRPCLRCKPSSPPLAERNAAQVAELCRFITASEEEPSLAELALHAGLSPSHTHRLFKAVTGVTPKVYGAARRAERVRARLESEPSVTRALYGAGFASSSRFYDQAPRMLGMKPKQYRAAGAQSRIRFAVGECSLGSVLVAATERGICAILLGDDPEQLAHELERRFRRAELVGADAEFERWVAQVIGLIDQPGAALALPLDVQGTAFQARVWDALCRIPPGKTVSYAELARELGQPRAVRAVARACASNLVAVAIPCHRVIRSDGDLSGYRWGVERKRLLLEREAGAAQPPR